MRSLSRALLTAALALPSLTACVGHLSVDANIQVEPRLLLPGGVMTIELVLAGEGLLANTVRDQVSPEGFAEKAAGLEWQVTDTSDEQTLRVKAVSHREIDGAFDAASLPGTPLSDLRLDVADYLVFRTYRLHVALPMDGASAGGDALAKQTATAALAALRYDWSVTLPGTIRSTNGVVSSTSGKALWHIDVASQRTHLLDAESLYVDVPRIAVMLGILAAALALRLRRRRTAAPVAAELPAAG
jgi:hypothetical protein